MVSILPTRKTSTSTTRSSSRLNLVGLDLETLNHCLVCYGCDPERRRRVAAKELARQLLQDTDSDDSEDSHPTHDPH